jgi:hypothetical protein
MKITKKIRVCIITHPSVIGAHIINALRYHPQIELVGLILEKNYLSEISSLPRLFAFFKKTGWHYSFYKFITTVLAWQLLKLRGYLNNYSGKLRSENNINSPEVIEWLKTLNCDYICVAYSLLKVNKELLSIAKKRTIVMHASFLPRYGGPEPTMRMMGNNDYLNAGTTIFCPSERLDAGNILYQEKIDTDPPYILSTLDNYLWKEGGKYLANWVVDDYAHPGKFQEKIVDPNQLDYQSFPNAKEVKKFHQQHGHLLDYKNYLKEINELIQHETNHTT